MAENLMADFIADKDFIPDSNPAAKSVASPDKSFIPDAKFISDEEKYGEGFLPQAKAFGLGAARSASFGLSDEFLTRTGAMKPEDIEAYRQNNPGLTTAGEVGGVLGSVLAPEVGILGAISAPVRAVSRLGGAVTEGASALLPEATSTVGKILSQAGALAAGSAIEGTAYGLGQSVSEHALGDPDLNAEKVMANIGTSALIGGALGSMFGAAKGVIQTKFPKFLSEVDKAAIDGGDFEAMAKSSDMPESTKNGFIDGLTKLKPDAKEIKEAAFALDNAPVLPGMISDAEAVQKGQSALLEGPPSYPSLRAQQLAHQGFEKAGSVVENSLGSDSDLTKASLGDTLKSMVSDSIQKQVEPINALYDELKNHYESIPISESATRAIESNIRKLDEVRISPSSSEAKLALRVADEIGNLKTVDDVKAYKTLLSRSSAPEERHMVSVLSEKLANLEENSIVRLAENEMKTSTAKEKIMSLLDMREAANAQYSVFRDKLQRLGDVLGKKKVYGSQDFLNHLENKLTNEQIADRLSGKKNSEFLNWFSKEMPEAMDAISTHQKGLIRQASMKDGEFNIRRAISEIDKLPKEYQEKIFTPEELKKLGYAKRYIQAFPKNFNPSNTSNASAFRSFFSSPTGAVLGNTRDYAIETFINLATSSGDQTKEFIDGLSSIERGVQKTSRSVGRGVNLIFSDKDSGSPVKGYLAISPQERRDNHDKLHPSLSEMNANPEKLIDKIHENTDAMAAFAPKTAASAQATMVKATQFLQNKLPGNGIPQKPLSPKYKPSDSELSKWHKYFSAIDSPTDILHHVAYGSLIPEQVEAVSVVYPKLMQEMKVAVTEKMTDHISKDKMIPYRTKLSLSLFLGTDLVNSLDSKSMLATQNMMATATQAKNMKEQMPSVNNKSLGKMKQSNRLMTSMQKSTQREDS